jgi:hypothetical protein
VSENTNPELGWSTRLKRSWAKAQSALLGNWPIIFTVFVGLAAAFGWVRSDSASSASLLATYISGVTSAIAIVWLVAGLRIQAAELSLQRQELRLQRLAAQQQARELRSSAKLGSLSQIRSLLEEAEKSIRDSPLGITTPLEIQNVYFEKMSFWHDIENSSNFQVVIDSYNAWLPAEAVAKNYVRYIASALRIYIEHHYPDAQIDFNKEPEDFVYIYQSWGHKAPFISHHIGVSAMLAQFLWLMKPGLERMRLAWLVASAKSLGTSFLKEGSLEELRDNVLKRSETLPAICDPWPQDK